MTSSSKTGERMVPVLYCDIDGTIRHGKDELGHFVNNKEDVRVFDGVELLLRAYQRLGWRIVGISNQGGIALGHMTHRDCARAMAETNRQCGHTFDLITWCSHHPNVENPEMAVCWCRKPRPGMVIESALTLSERYPGEIYPPHMGLFVGDRPEDEQCAQNANLSFMGATDWRAGKHLQAIT